MATVERLQKALARAAELADIADDWNLPYVELSDGWVAVRNLAREFRTLANGGDPPKCVGQEDEDAAAEYDYSVS